MTTAYNATVDKGFPASCPHCLANAKKQVVGAFIKAATTPSSQGAGVNGATAITWDRETGYVVVGGVKLDIAAAADVAVASGVTPSLVQADEGYEAAYVAYLNSTTGAVSTAIVLGTIATAVTAAADIPAVTDAQIQAAVGAANTEWTVIARTKFERTADTTITHHTWENSARYDGNMVTTSTTLT